MGHFYDSNKIAIFKTLRRRTQYKTVLEVSPGPLH